MATGAFTKMGHDRAIESDLRKREDSQDDEAQVAHRRVSHQLLHIGLHHGHQRAVQNSDDGEHLSLIHI